MLAEEERKVDVVVGGRSDLFWKFLPSLVEAPQKADLEVEKSLEATQQVGHDRKRDLAGLLAEGEEGVGGLRFFLLKIFLPR